MCEIKVLEGKGRRKRGAGVKSADTALVNGLMAAVSTLA
jgi:hypothetical protein